MVWVVGWKFPHSYTDTLMSKKTTEDDDRSMNVCWSTLLCYRHDKFFDPNSPKNQGQTPFTKKVVKVSPLNIRVGRKREKMLIHGRSYITSSQGQLQWNPAKGTGNECRPVPKCLTRILKVVGERIIPRDRSSLSCRFLYKNDNDNNFFKKFHSSIIIVKNQRSTARRDFPLFMQIDP